MAFKYIVPALAVASGVAAQFGGSSSGSPCSVSATTTLKSQADATALSSCSTFQGSIAIDPETVDNIDLSGISQITGDLFIDGASITQLSGSQLSVIGGEFHLNELTRLSTANFPSLVNVGSIYWNALPNLQSLNFAQGVQMLKSLDIENTGLASLQGISLQTAESIFIANNNYLQQISMPLGNVTKGVNIGNNGQNLAVSFPNLKWAYNMTLRGVDSVSTPALQSVNTSLGFYASSFDTYSAPNLTTVGGALSFVSDTQLNNISLPALASIGNALYLVANPELKMIDGFPMLKTIGGALVAIGSFSNFTFPAISTGFVKGATNITSTENISSSCSVLAPLAGKDKALRGKYNCAQSASAANANSNTVNDNQNGGTTDKSAASGLLIPSTAVLGVVAVLFGLL